MTRPTHILAQAAAKLDVRKALRILQNELRFRLGAKSRSDYGQNAIMIGPDKVDMTNEQGTIVARGHARVATVLVRKRRKAK